MAKVVVDRNKCTGLGVCEAEAPDLFEIADSGDLIVLQDRPDRDQLAEARAACAACPTEALTLVEDHEDAADSDDRQTVGVG